MHFAICVWGIVRSLRFTIDSIHNYCLDPIVNAGHTYEIYMHTYKFSGVYDNLRSNERGLRLNFSEWQVLQPDHIFLEDQDMFDQTANFEAYQTQGDPWNNNYRSFQNHLRAMNSLNYLALQVEKDSQHTHFDGVVYLRPDVTYLNELPFHLIEHIPNTLFVPDFHRSCHGGEYNDRMAMGDLQTGLVYGKKFQAALDYSKSKPLHSEKFVYDYLVMNNVTVKEIPFRFRRTRANGEFHKRDGTAIVAPRHQKPQREYTTFCALRWLYTLVEVVTNNNMYVWNHDDNENLYCKPHDFLTIQQVLQYRKLSRKKRVMRRERQYLSSIRDNIGSSVGSIGSGGSVAGGSVVGSGDSARARDWSGVYVNTITNIPTPDAPISTSSSIDDADGVYRKQLLQSKRAVDTSASVSPATNRQKRRRRKRAGVGSPYSSGVGGVSRASSVSSASSASVVSRAGGGDGRDLTASKASAYKPAHSAHLAHTTHTTASIPKLLTQPVLPGTTHSEYNLRGMASRELEEKQARLKKTRSLEEV